jgi:hypothetical protein
MACGGAGWRATGPEVRVDSRALRAQQYDVRAIRTGFARREGCHAGLEVAQTVVSHVSNTPVVRLIWIVIR